MPIKFCICGNLLVVLVSINSYDKAKLKNRQFLCAHMVNFSQACLHFINIAIEHIRVSNYITI